MGNFMKKVANHTLCFRSSWLLKSRKLFHGVLHKGSTPATSSWNLTNFMFYSRRHFHLAGFLNREIHWVHLTIAFMIFAHKYGCVSLMLETLLNATNAVAERWIWSLLLNRYLWADKNITRLYHLHVKVQQRECLESHMWIAIEW